MCGGEGGSAHTGIEASSQIEIHVTCDEERVSPGEVKRARNPLTKYRQASGVDR